MHIVSLSLIITNFTIHCSFQLLSFSGQADIFCWFLVGHHLSATLVLNTISLPELSSWFIWITTMMTAEWHWCWGCCCCCCPVFARTRSHWRVCAFAWLDLLITIMSMRRSWRKLLRMSCLSMSSSWLVQMISFSQIIFGQLTYGVIAAWSARSFSVRCCYLIARIQFDSIVFA